MQTMSRVVRFPEERAIGELRLHAVVGGAVRERRPAQGEQEIPPDHRAVLTVTVDDAAAALAAIVDGALDGLHFRAGGDGDLAAIGHLLSLTELSVPPATTDAGLSCVARLPGLRSLTITAPAVTISGFVELAGTLTALTDLLILGAQLGDDALAAVSGGFPALGQLTVQGCSVSNGALADLAEARPGLIVNGRPATAERNAALRRAPAELAYRFLPERTVTFPPDRSVGQFGHAGPLGFAATAAAQGTLTVPALADGILHLGGDAITEPGLLDGLEPDAIQYVYATGPEVDDRVAAALGRLSGLTALHLGPSVTDAGIAALSGLSALQTLDLASASLSDAGLLAVLPLWGLRGLSVASPGVTAAVLPVLGTLPHLRSLALRDAAIGDEDVEAFAGAFPSLTQLTLTGTAVSIAGLLRLARLHPGIALNGTELTEAGIRRMERKLAVSG